MVSSKKEEVCVSWKAREGFPGEGRLEGSEALSLGKRTTFHKGKHLNKGLMVGRGSWRRWHPVTLPAWHT